MKLSYESTAQQDRRVQRAAAEQTRLAALQTQHEHVTMWTAPNGSAMHRSMVTLS
jgi:hypothetical protein